MEFVDAHCHVHEFGEDDLGRYCNSKKFKIIAVSDDLQSSLKTLKISKTCLNIIPCVGIHPWNVGKVSEKDLEVVLEVAKDVRFLGEVGIDKRFVPETYEKQLQFFRRFVEYSSSNGLGINVHAAGAWEDALRILFKYDVKLAIMHWYTGPITLLKDISSVGYYITVNPAVRIQLKSREVVLNAPLDMILTESDSPYEYRGMKLVPERVVDAVNEIASIKGVGLEEVINAVLNNYYRILNIVGLPSTPT
ncbi:MAG: TatD family hydrolase [Sulfolobales archaeon]